MSAFVAWLPSAGPRAGRPAPDPARALLEGAALARPRRLETGAVPGVAWAAAVPQDAPGLAPVTAEDAGAGLALVLFGAIFAVDGARLGDAPAQEAAARLLTLAAEDPGGWPARFRGHAAVLLSDARRGRMIAARDPMGAQPLYWRRGERGVALAAAGRFLLDLDGCRPGADRGHVARFLVQDVLRSDACGTERTFIEGVSRVPPGGTLTLADGDARSERVFDLGALFAASKDPEPDPAAYRALLDRVIGDQAGNGQGVGVTLSGGLDSPAIALLLARRLGEGRPLPTISLGDLGHGADESGNVRSVLDDIAARPVWVTPDESRIFETLREAHAQLEAPLFSPSPAVFMLLKRAAAEAGVVRVFGGLGADEALGGLNLGFLTDLLLRGRLMRFWRELTAARDVDALRQNMSRARLLREHVLDPSAPFRRLPPPSWIRSDLAAEFGLKGGRGAHPRLPGLDVFDGRAAAILGRTFTQSFLHYESHLAVAWGVENRFPYLDPDLLACAARLPWHARFSEGTYKHHHRRAFAGLFPEKVGMQKKKSLIPAVHDHWLRSAAREPVSAIVEQGGAWTDFLDAEAVRREHHAYLAAEDEGTRNRLRRSTWRAVTLELFLQSLKA